jgi:hypothetical protein
MPEQFSDYIVFVDESGDHGLASIDPNYPMFVLAFCIFKKEEYVSRICPALQKIKLDFWGHDEMVLHEHDIRKPSGRFNFLRNEHKRLRFLSALNDFIDQSPFSLVAAAIQKSNLAGQYSVPENPYELAMEFGLERVFYHLKSLGQAEKTTHVVVECRGKREDAELELAFRRICDKANRTEKKLPFELVMIPKAANSCGLQLADLIARPIGIKILRPTQSNRSYEIIERKFRRSPEGVIKGWGLKVFP